MDARRTKSSAKPRPAAGQKGPVTGKMIMGDIVRLYPQAVPIIQQVGLHCVGCGVAYWESLEDGCKAHGMVQEDVQDLLAAINRSIKENPADTHNQLTITPTAIAKLKEMLKGEGKTGWGLRVSAVPGGLAADSYEMDFEAEPKAGDTVIEEGGIKFMISPQSLPSVFGAAIDYAAGEKGSGFSIRNPGILPPVSSAGKRPSGNASPQ